MPINQRLCDQSRPPRQRDSLINLALDPRSEERGCLDPDLDPSRPTQTSRALCHGSSHKLFDYSFINIHLIHLRRPRGKRTNERGAEYLLFVPLTLASPFACRSSVTSRDPSKGRSYSHANSRGRTAMRTAGVSPRSSP